MALSQAWIFKDKFPLVRSCSLLNEIRIAEDIKDIAIEVHDKSKLNVHRIILAARIPSLRAALSDPFGEHNRVLSWPSIPLNLATSLINYVYTGQLEVTQNNVRGIIMFARMVDLPLLEKYGVEFMVKSVDSDNLAATWDFAIGMNIALLKEACIQQMKNCFECFVYSELFVRLPADTVLTLFRSDELPVKSEEQIVGAICRWICPCGEVDCDKLSLNAVDMLKEVQWHQTSLQFRERLLESYPMFTDNPGCARFMLSVERWIGTADKAKLPCPFNRHSRRPQSVFVFGMDANKNRWSVLRFDLHMQNEERVADMELRYGATFSVVGENIFVVGGQTTQQTGSTCVDEFVVKERRWNKRSSLATRRRDHAAAVLRIGCADKEGGEKELLGVFGGSFKEGNEWTNLASCELYDVSQDRWYKLPDLREKRNGPGATSLPGDNRIFVFGGHDVTGHATTTYCHLRSDWQERAASANSTEFWLPAAPMRNARSYLAAAYFRGRIIVAGGISNVEIVNVVEIFSPPDARSPLGQWTEIAGMQRARYSFTILTAADAVYALGNFKEQKNTVETLTAAEGSLDFGNDLTSWIWRPTSPVETLCDIEGGTSIKIQERIL